MANIIPLKDNTGAQFYPQTHEKAVVDSNGVSLQTKLASITTPTYVTAWDGASTPVVANIPAGVSVTYNTTTYTGTLAASASTANKTYLVSTGTTDNYNRYVTQLNGSTYSWQNLGSTEIDLSDYATKEELGQLDQIDYTLAEYYEQKGIITTSGAATTSENFTRYIIKNKGYSRIKVTAYTSATYMAIAFYNSLDWGSSTFMQSDSVVGRNYTQTYDVPVPSGCQCIIVCNWTSNRPLPVITLYGGGDAESVYSDFTGVYDGRFGGVETRLSDLIFDDGMGIGTSTGEETANTKTICCATLLKVADYAINGRLYFAYNGISTNKIWKAVAFFTANNTYIPPRFGFKDVDSVGVPFNAVYFRLALGLASSGGTDIGGHAADYDLGNAYIRKSLRVVLDNINTPGELVYTGAKIMIQNKMGVKNFMTLSSTYGSPQGAAAFGKYLFVFHDGNASAQVYNLETVSLLQSVTMTESSADYHCNSVAFGTQKADAGDAFPLLYVGMEKSTVHKALVYRVQEASGVWSLTKVQEIIFPEPSDDTIWYPNVCIDRDANKFYIFGLGNNPYQTTRTNTLKYARFPMPVYGEGDVSLSWENKEDLFSFTNEPTGQGNVCINGRIYQALGLNDNAELIVINPVSHSIESRIDFTGNGISKEPEYVFEYNGDLYVGFAGREVYKLLF